MGMYTEICTNVPLVENLPEDVLVVLRYMAEGGDRLEMLLPDHPFFTCDRWRSILCGSSHYFIPFPHTKLAFNEIANQYFLCARADLKNYDGEIEKFFDWLDPYIDMQPGEFVGYSRYEECNKPTLFFKRGGK